MRVVTIVSLKLVLHPILPHAVSIWGVGVGGGSFGVFLASFYRTEVSLGSDLWVRLSLTTRRL